MLSTHYNSQFCLQKCHNPSLLTVRHIQIAQHPRDLNDSHPLFSAHLSDFHGYFTAT
ncbi:hypothetical protein B0F90DRAFT_1728579 [Multifurca ochricompacta]|uniref:Uncharacterized protein n=1 Tax=Multifurca ochricompacta TaxID=376703 RepID=A0AAD4M2Y4_9AGAM|nr:hypothetical protein B0F90DRAFT_1728579 [Multifurca ochricompacta]